MKRSHDIGLEGSLVDPPRQSAQRGAQIECKGKNQQKAEMEATHMELYDVICPNFFRPDDLPISLHPLFLQGQPCHRS